ncbi:MAG: hypothetical protein FJX03_05500 [Alphaproteobacteria bacterium]|nr:hypothetical protein [Alphaproteobacteria bacterium]
MSDSSILNSFKFYFLFIALILLSLFSSSILQAYDEREQSTSTNRFTQTDSSIDDLEEALNLSKKDAPKSQTRQYSALSQKTLVKKRQHKKDESSDDGDDEEYSPNQNKSKRSRSLTVKDPELSQSKSLLSDSSWQSSLNSANEYNEILPKEKKLPNIVYYDYMGITAEMSDLQRRYAMSEPHKRVLDSDNEESDHANVDNHRESSRNNDDDNSTDNSAGVEDITNQVNFDSLISFGTTLKLLANVYLGNLDERANIFLPQYVLDLKQDDGSVQKGPPEFFKIKDKICVFASGGTHNAWEKTVAKVYEIFFGQKVKIVRVEWIYKHLLKKNGESAKRFYEKLRGKEKTLHSEFYYDLVFRNFILPRLMEQHPNKIKNLTINAFSWWEICDECHSRFLEKHQRLCRQNGIRLVFNVVAREQYKHNYPASGLITTSQVQEPKDKQFWKEIWQQLRVYVIKYPDNNGEKEAFWTNSPEGLELCKWIGQAFVENKRKLAEQTGSAQIQGDIRGFYEATDEVGRKNFDELINYLREHNWELSCWYYPSHFADSIQGKWKTHSKQVVIPHFNWEHLRTIRDATGQCQMCGYDGLHNIYQVYHPKHGTSKKIAAFEAEEAKKAEKDVAYKVADNTPFNKIPKSQQEKMKRSLFVGSECLKFMQVEKTEIDEWRVKNPEQLVQERLASANLQRRDAIASELSEASPLLRWMTKFSREHNNAPVKRSDIVAYARRNSGDLYEGAKELSAYINALIQAGKIELQDKKSTPGNHVYIIK